MAFQGRFLLAIPESLRLLKAAESGTKIKRFMALDKFRVMMSQGATSLLPTDYATVSVIRLSLNFFDADEEAPMEIWN